MFEKVYVQQTEENVGGENLSPDQGIVCFKGAE